MALAPRAVSAVGTWGAADLICGVQACNCRALSPALPMSEVKPIADADVMDEFQAMMAELGQESGGKGAVPTGAEPVSLEQAEQAAAVPQVDLSQYQHLGIVDEDVVEVSDKDLNDLALLAELRAYAGDGGHEAPADSHDAAATEPAGGQGKKLGQNVSDAATGGAKEAGEGERKSPDPDPQKSPAAAAARAPAATSARGMEGTMEVSTSEPARERSTAAAGAGRAAAAEDTSEQSTQGSPRASAEWEKRKALLAKQRGDKDAALAHMRRYKQLTAGAGRTGRDQHRRQQQRQAKPQQPQQPQAQEQQQQPQEQQQRQAWWRRSQSKGQAKEEAVAAASPRRAPQQAPPRAVQTAAAASHTPSSPASPQPPADAGTGAAAAKTWDRLESVLRKQLAKAERGGVQCAAAAAAREELNRFLAARSTPGQPVPRYRIETRVEQSEVFNEDVGPTSLEVTVLSASGLPPHAPGKPESRAYVVCNLGFPRDDPTVFKTHTAESGVSAEWNKTHTVTLNRTRSVARQMERRKAVFEIFHERGWFRSDVWIAQAIMPWVRAAALVVL